MATHSSILAWKIPRTGKPGWLQSMGYKESDTSESLHMQGSSEELCKARDFIRRREQEQGSCTKQKKKKKERKKKRAGYCKITVLLWDGKDLSGRLPNKVTRTEQVILD